jgi:hypothetical protein
MARAVLVLILVVTVWSTALEARSSGESPYDPTDCVRAQLPPGVRVPLGARVQVIDRCDLELRRRIGEEGLLERGRGDCRGLQSRRCATDPVSAS